MIECGRCEVITLLVDTGVDINHRDSSTGCTCLFLVRYASVAELLLSLVRAPPPPFFSILLCSTSLLNYSTVLSAAHISALSIFHDWLTTCIAAHIQGVDVGIRNNNGQTAIEFLRATLMGEVADYIQSRVDAIAAGKVRENDIG